MERNLPRVSLASAVASSLVGAELHPPWHLVPRSIEEAELAQGSRLTRAKAKVQRQRTRPVGGSLFETVSISTVACSLIMLKPIGTPWTVGLQQDSGGHGGHGGHGDEAVTPPQMDTRVNSFSSSVLETAKCESGARFRARRGGRA